MAAFKVRKMKDGTFEIAGLEAYVAKLVTRALEKPAGAKAPRPVKKVAAPAKKAVGKEATPFDQMLAALAQHPRKAELIRAGKQKDQLLRSLVPLYLARSLSIEVTSGLISRFWQAHGVRYAPPNAAKALREHVGYARSTRGGRQITPNGIKYVESALQRAA